MFQVGTNISPIIHTICKWMSCPLNCPFLFQFWYVTSHHIYQLYFQSVNMSMFSALWTLLLCSSVQFSFSVVSDSSQPNRLQHTRPPCPLPTPGVYSNSCPLSWWCHPAISSFVVPFSSCLQSFPAWGSFPVSQFFTPSGQSIGVSASTSVLPMNIQDWFPLGWTGWITLQSEGLSRVFSNTTAQKSQFFYSCHLLIQSAHSGHSEFHESQFKCLNAFKWYQDLYNTKNFSMDWALHMCSSLSVLSGSMSFSPCPCATCLPAIMVSGLPGTLFLCNILPLHLNNSCALRPLVWT